MSATEFKESAERRLCACLLHTSEPEVIPSVRAMTDAELQAHLETKLAAHHAQRGVVL